MPPLIPNRFLIRVAHPCPYLANWPVSGSADQPMPLLPETGRLENFAGLDGGKNFAEIRLAWNELGMAVQLTVTGKQQLSEGEPSRPWTADGLTLWIDTRDARSAHRASRYCHQFHLLPIGNGPDEATFAQSKINRAQQDAPIGDASSVLIVREKIKSGYRLDTFLPAGMLTGYDPEQFRRLGVYYHVRDQELGDQYLGVGADFPIADDPSLWEPLDLIKD